MSGADFGEVSWTATRGRRETSAVAGMHPGSSICSMMPAIEKHRHPCRRIASTSTSVARIAEDPIRFNTGLSRDAETVERDSTASSARFRPTPPPCRAAQQIGGQRITPDSRWTWPLHGFFRSHGVPLRGCLSLSHPSKGLEPIAVLRQVDGVGDVPRIATPASRRPLRQFQRSLAAENCHDNAGQGALFPFLVNDLQPVFQGQRLE